MDLWAGLDDFRAEVQRWCREHVPPDWRAGQTGASDEEFVAFQKAWFQQLRSAGYAVPHWPREWGGGMSTAQQVVLYQELAAQDAPRLVLAFVAIHHAAATLLEAGTEEQRQRHLPAILDGEIWVQGFSEPEAGSDLAALRTSARREGDSYVVNGQKLWASGARHADWCLLLARSDPDAPKRAGISYFLMDMRSPGIDVRPIRNAIGDAHFCEIFLSDVTIPAANLIGEPNKGWQAAQSTLGAERGLTMLELAERLGNGGFRWLLDACAHRGEDGTRPLDLPVVADKLAALETELTGLRALCSTLVERHEAGTAGPADASIVKLYYSELLQRLTDFGTEVTGLASQTVLAKPRSSGWESGAWVLDFIGSWEWTIPGGSSEIQRTIIGERGLGLPPGTGMTAESGEFRAELAKVAREMLTAGASWEQLADAGWFGLEIAEESGGSATTFAEAAVILQELGRAAAPVPYLGTAVLGVGVLNLLEEPAAHDLLPRVAEGTLRLAVALPSGDARDLPLRLDGSGGRLRLTGTADFVADASSAEQLLLAAVDPEGTPVIVAAAGVAVTEQQLVDATRSFGSLTAAGMPVNANAVWHFRDDPRAGIGALLDRAALAVSCDCLGIAEAMLEATVAYAGVRHQFGRAIGSFQAVKHACADMLAQITIGRELLASAVDCVVNEDPEAWVAVSMAKSFLGTLAVDVAGKAMQLHGGFGYTWESGVHAYLKRAVLDRSLFGSPAAHRARLARRYGQPSLS